MSVIQTPALTFRRGDAAQPPARAAASLRRRHPSRSSSSSCSPARRCWRPGSFGQNPYDLAALDLLDSHLPPAFLAAGIAKYWLGTDSQGADLVSLTSTACARRCGRAPGGALCRLPGTRGRARQRLCRRPGRQHHNAHRRRAVHLPGDATGAPDRRHQPVAVIGDRRAALAVPIVVLALGISHWPHFARLVRGAALVERQKDYVAAAQLVGHGKLTIMTTQLLPNVLNPIFVLATLDIAFAIMSEATLSFLGFGMPPTSLRSGRSSRSATVTCFPGSGGCRGPGVTLVILLVAVNIFGDWLRDLLDPRISR